MSMNRLFGFRLIDRANSARAGAHRQHKTYWIKEIKRCRSALGPHGTAKENGSVRGIIGQAWLVTEDVIRTGSFASVAELVRDIKAYLAERNANPKPYKWKAKGRIILEKKRRAREALDKMEAA
jgi:hypothetical protein